MIKNILITGAKGFIGSNLMKKLETDSNLIIHQFNRDSSLEELDNTIDDIDFIFHFAGEVRPQSSDEEMHKSNAILTKQIIDLLEKKQKAVPFLMTSSIHAEIQKNEYGRSKKEAEEYLQAYGKHTSALVLIYRLPHIFGEGCKPNYNSAMTTWIYNSIHNLPITIFDRTIPMEYSYVQELVDEFASYIGDTLSPNQDSIYKPKITYHTTLGEVIECICALLDMMEPRTDGSSYKILVNDTTDEAKLGIEENRKSDEKFKKSIEKTIEWYVENYR